MSINLSSLGGRNFFGIRVALALVLSTLIGYLREMLDIVLANGFGSFRNFADLSISLTLFIGLSLSKSIVSGLALSIKSIQLSKYVLSVIGNRVRGSFEGG